MKTSVVSWYVLALLCVSYADTQVKSAIKASKKKLDEGEDGDDGTRLLSKKEKERLKKEKEKVRKYQSLTRPFYQLSCTHL